MRQISLPFDRPIHAGSQAKADEFLVSEANRIAVRHLENWRGWPLAVSVLSGPPLSGRSTLGRHFVAQSGGAVIDDAQRHDERTLFYAWKDAQQRSEEHTTELQSLMRHSYAVFCLHRKHYAEQHRSK